MQTENFIELPIVSGKAKAILECRQIAFADYNRHEALRKTIIRHENHASALFEIFMVRRLTLNYVSGHHYRECGFLSQKDFLRVWGERHKSRPIDLKDKVFLHYLREVKPGA